MINNKLSLEDLEKYIKYKVDTNQEGVGTFLDNIVLESENKTHNIFNRILDTFEKTGRNRFVPILNRLRNLRTSDLDFIGRLYSQGVHNCMSWRGKPLFKSVHDFAIYQMLIYELCPGTIIEIGTTNTSLLWYKDIVKMFNINTRIVGIDLRKPNNLDDDIHFIHGDIKNIPQLLPQALLDSFPKPWLIIEDAHAHTLDVISYVANSLTSGDYFIIEDSINKIDTIRIWANRIEEESFAIDTYYTDFFGVNATSAANSIITKR